MTITADGDYSAIAVFRRAKNAYYQRYELQDIPTSATRAIGVIHIHRPPGSRAIVRIFIFP